MRWFKRAHLAQRLRFFADRIDRAHAPRATGWSFTFENGRGVVFNDKKVGCPLWYLADSDYERAHTESFSHTMEPIA